MTNRVPWSRLLAEAVVVIASILLAFGIDASWDGRQLRQEEREVLRGLEQELHEVRQVTDAARAETNQAQQRLLSFLSATPEEVARILPPEAADEVYYPLVRQWGGRSRGEPWMLRLARVSWPGSRIRL